MARVLLTGASGFLGAHMLAELSTRPGIELHATNRRGIGYAGPTWHAADLRSSDEAAALVRHIKPTHVLHNAWDVTPGLFWTNPENTLWADASIALASACVETGARLVGIGTCAEYDWSDPVLSENTPLLPATPYGKAKARVWDHIAASGANAAWARVFLPYGPGDNPKRLVPSVVASLLRHQAIELSSGLQERDFIFAPDVARMCVELLLGDRAGAFNVGTGIGTSVRTVVESVADMLKADRALLLFGARPDNNEPPRLVADMARTHAAFGARATNVLEGIRWRPARH